MTSSRLTVSRLLAGVFPQDEYPEEVSTDEDDDMFGSRKRMKRRGRRSEQGEEPVSKKSKGTCDTGRSDLKRRSLICDEGLN